MFIDSPLSTSDTTKLYESSLMSQGFVMNLTRAWAWRTDVFDGFAALRNQLVTKSTLSKRDQAVLVCATAAELGDSYCALAWARTLADEVDPASAAAVIENSSRGTLTDRDRELARWARKVVANPNSTTVADVETLKAAGFDDRAVFEITVFIAFRLAFSTVNDALGINPDKQLTEQLPPEVQAVVTFGRQATAV